MMNRFCESRREQFKSVLNGHQCRWMVRWMWKNVVYEKFHKVIYNRMGTTYRNRVSSTSNTFRDSFASQLFLFSSSKIHSLPANHLDKLVGQVFTASADSGKVFSNEDSLSLSLLSMEFDVLFPSDPMGVICTRFKVGGKLHRFSCILNTLWTIRESIPVK